MARQSQTRGTRHGVHGGGLGRVLFVAVLMAMLLMPLSGRGVGAQPIDQVDPTILQDQPVAAHPHCASCPVRESSRTKPSHMRWKL